MFIQKVFIQKVKPALLALTCVLVTATPASAQSGGLSFGGLGNILKNNPNFGKAVDQAQASTDQGSPTTASPTTFKFPLSKTDFKFTGNPTQQANCGKLTTDAAQQQTLVDACLTVFNSVIATPDFRKDNLAEGVALLIGACLQALADQELSDEDSTALERGINDALVDSGVMAKMKPAEVQNTYELAVMIGGLIAGIAQNAKDSSDDSLAQTAKDMAKAVLEVFGIGGSGN